LYGDLIPEEYKEDINMVDHITDSVSVSIVVIHPGNADIYEVTAPTAVEENTPFTVSYKVKNLGDRDDIWGQIKDSNTGMIIAGTRWDVVMNKDEIKEISATIPGITTNINLLVEAGYAS
jgi:hypothetical protein